jgi:hypothetical protein
MAKSRIVSRLGGSKLGAKLDRVADASKVVRHTARKAKEGIEDLPPPSPNPMTNLVIADIALRGGGRLLRLMVEHNLLKTKYPKDTAISLVKGRGMAQALIGTAVARIATRSVPGAILVGGGLLAKTLYDRRKGDKAEEKGKKAVARRAAKGA